jgi:multicomponent Na+:H+ antiporter subunit D
MIVSLPVFVALPLVTAFVLTLFSPRHKAVATLMANLAAVVCLVLVILSLEQSGSYQVGRWPVPLGISLVKDGLTTLMLLTITVVTVAALLFSCRYMEQYTAKPKFFSLLFLMIAGMNGIVLSGDIFNMFVFLEVASIASYGLVAFGCERQELEAAFKYMVLGSVGAGFVLLGIALVYGHTGTLNLAQLAEIIRGSSVSHYGLTFALALFVGGFALKGALVPFHAWLPDAHQSAPAPVSAMLSGVLIKSLGVYALARITFNVYGISTTVAWTLMTLGVLSMVVGVFLAVGQWDFKRLLAYHSISQMGYVVMGLGLGALILAQGGSTTTASLAILGGLFHLMNHAVFKSLLFLTSGSVEMATGTRQLKELGGLLQPLPYTRTSCTIASAAIAGIPPFSGFWSKLILVVAAVQAQIYWLAAVTALVSLVTLISFLKVQRYVFLGDLPERFASIRENRGTMLAAMLFLAVLCTTMGLLVIVPAMREGILMPAVTVLMDGLHGAPVVLNQ